MRHPLRGSRLLWRKAPTTTRAHRRPTHYVRHAWRAAPKGETTMIAWIRKPVRRELFGSTIALIFAVLMIIATLPATLIWIMLLGTYGSVNVVVDATCGNLAPMLYGWHVLAGILAYRSRKRVVMDERENSTNRTVTEATLLIFSITPIIPFMSIIGGWNNPVRAAVIENPIPYLPIAPVWILIAYAIQLRKMRSKAD